MGRLIRDGNQVYEIDEECIREKEHRERDWLTESTKDTGHAGDTENKNYTENKNCTEYEEEYGQRTHRRNNNGRTGNRFPFGC